MPLLGEQQKTGKTPARVPTAELRTSGIKSRHGDMAKKKEIDNPFDEEFIDCVKYILYHTNAGGMAANPAHPSWYTPANYPENSPERYNKRNTNQ